MLRATALLCPTCSPAVLPQIQPSSCLGWVEGPSHTPNLNQPHRAPPHPSSSPGCKALYRCGLSGAIPRVTPLQPLPGLKTLLECSTSPAHIPHSPSAPLLTHPPPRVCHGLSVPAHGQWHVGSAMGKAGHISAWASCLFSQALFAGAKAIT